MTLNNNEAENLLSPAINLREIEQADYAAIHHIASNPITCRYTIWGPNTEIDTQNFIQEVLAEQVVKPRTHWTYAMCNDSQLIGTAAVWITEEKHIELGYMVNPELWGRGYATHTVCLLLEFAHKQWPDVEIRASTDPENLASRRVLEKSGFQIDRYIENHKRLASGWRDSVIYRHVR